MCLMGYKYRGSKERLAAFVGVWGEAVIRWSTRPNSVNTGASGDSIISPEGICATGASQRSQLIRRTRWEGNAHSCGHCRAGKEIASVLMIRLSRRGARKQPYYRIVVIEKDRARDGRWVEVVGTYNPRTDPASVELKRERIAYWTSKGAQLSDRVKKLVDKAAASAPAPTAA